MPGEKYCPSNGTEGEGFMENHCYQCLHDNGKDKICEILMASMSFFKIDPKFPKEWTYDDSGRPTCTEYKKWDWGNDGDPDDPDNPKYRPPDLDNPMQLTMPFIFDELEIKKYEPKRLLTPKIHTNQ